MFLQLGLQEFGHDLDTTVPAHNHYCTDSKFHQQNMTFLVHFGTNVPFLVLFNFLQQKEVETRFKILLSSTYCHSVIKLTLIWLSTIQHKTLARITASVTIHVHCIFFHWASFFVFHRTKYITHVWNHMAMN